MATRTPASTKITCFHCGEPCLTDKIQFDAKSFCCEGCRMVYSIINEKGLCEYYNLNEKPGFNHRIQVRADKFAFLDDSKVAARLISFSNDQQVHATFYLPQMHCSSCLYLLENLHRVAPGILSSKVNFTRREAEIVFSPTESSVRKVAEALTSIGYEPWISLSDLKEKRPGVSKKMIYQLGVAGFCFGNIMLMSFPEYLGINASETGLRSMFRWANLLLAIPVFLYSAQPFYISSWKSIKHRYLNIDLPIALAIIITFSRSAYEIISGTGGGYFDSMTGIVFFMLTGRILQDKTYRQLSFERDYTSYFPVAVSVLKDNEEFPTVLPEIKNGDTLLIHHEELIPADGILTRGKAFIDYSFVTGESLPVTKEVGEMVYAGGRQTGGNIEILTVKEVAQSYLTKLWNRDTFKETETQKPRSFVHLLGKYFTGIVLLLALSSGIYWAIHDTTRLWPAVTSVFIIACPCALLLSNTFTNGNILQILGRNRLYLRNAETIEQMAKVDHIVFDKTGTLTQGNEQDIFYEGKPMSARQVEAVAALSGTSVHPLSRSLARYLNSRNDLIVEEFQEEAGAGLEGIIEGRKVRLGSPAFLKQKAPLQTATRVGVEIDGKFLGYYRFSNHYRQDIDLLLKNLKTHFKLSVISGDNEAERRNLETLLGSGARLLFRQQPEDKLNYIRELQSQGQKVMMIGDGLNDAGALKQSDTGIAVAEQTNNFTPSSDAIIGAENLPRLYQFIRLCRANRKIVLASFIISLLYNAAGNYFAVQGNLSPLIAAILMPLSSMSILLISFGSSSWVAKRMRL